MKVHLVKSAEVDMELFTQTVHFLQAIPGPVEFCCNKESEINIGKDKKLRTVIENAGNFEKQEFNFVSNNMCAEIKRFPLERDEVSWDTLFDKCALYRRKYRIGNDEFVILLTDIANHKNWFACLEEKNPFNGFIHTADWEYYINCSSAFPIAYEVIALILQKHMFNGFFDMRAAVHKTPVGCINDLCIQKKEIILKLRTADICSDCMGSLKDKMQSIVINHALQLMESLRVKMLYAQNFRQNAPLSRLQIDKAHKITLPDFENTEIRLRPLEKALYFLFLKHPKGIFLSSLSEHREELYCIYSQISTMGDMEEMRARIEDMVNALSNSASEKISRIKRVFEDAIGIELAKNYYICGPVGDAKVIALDRGKLLELNGK